MGRLSDAGIDSLLGQKIRLALQDRFDMESGTGPSFAAFVHALDPSDAAVRNSADILYDIFRTRSNRTKRRRRDSNSNSNSRPHASSAHLSAMWEAQSTRALLADYQSASGSGISPWMTMPGQGSDSLPFSNRISMSTSLPVPVPLSTPLPPNRRRSRFENQAITQHSDDDVPVSIPWQESLSRSSRISRSITSSDRLDQYRQTIRNQRHMSDRSPPVPRPESVRQPTSWSWSRDPLTTNPRQPISSPFDALHTRQPQLQPQPQSQSQSQPLLQSQPQVQPQARPQSSQSSLQLLAIPSPIPTPHNFSDQSNTPASSFSRQIPSFPLPLQTPVPLFPRSSGANTSLISTPTLAISRDSSATPLFLFARTYTDINRDSLGTTEDESSSTAAQIGQFMLESDFVGQLNRYFTDSASASSSVLSQSQPTYTSDTPSHTQTQTDTSQSSSSESLNTNVNTSTVAARNYLIVPQQVRDQIASLAHNRTLRNDSSNISHRSNSTYLHMENPDQQTPESARTLMNSMSDDQRERLRYHYDDYMSHDPPPPSLSISAGTQEFSNVDIV